MIHCFLTVCFCAHTCPNRSRGGGIDNPDLFEQVFGHYDISEVPEKVSSPTFRRFVVRKCSFLVFTGFCKQNCSQKSVNAKNEHFLTTNHRKVGLKILSGTLGI